MKPYQILISLEVVEAIEQLPRKFRLELRSRILDIKQDPLGNSDANEIDSKGRMVEIAIVGHHALTYWVDPADHQIKVLTLASADC